MKSSSASISDSMKEIRFLGKGRSISSGNELLVSPDYMFKNDQEQRIKHLFAMKSDDQEEAGEARKCGLYINKY